VRYAVLLLSVLLSPPLQSVLGEISPDSRTNSTFSSLSADGELWKYVLGKYSTSGSHLSSSDIFQLVKSSQKCSKTELLHENAFCEGMQANVKVEDLNGLKEICPKLLYFIDNPSCCDTKFLISESASLTQLSDDESILSSFSVDGKKREKEKPSSGEGNLIIYIHSIQKTSDEWIG
jgi:hypothetical protein